MDNFCGVCGTPIPKETGRCPRCSGAPVPDPPVGGGQKESGSRMFAVLFAVIGVLCFGFAAVMLCLSRGCRNEDMAPSGSDPAGNGTTADAGAFLTSEAPTAPPVQDLRVGDVIFFGSYPQTQVTDAAVLAGLDALKKNWISYGYCTGTGDLYDGNMRPGNWMRYADLTLDGSRYRAVTFDQYRPIRTGHLPPGQADAYQYANGYTVGRIYYFLYEPLLWRVLDPAAGLVLCENVVDAQPYHDVITGSAGAYTQKATPGAYANCYATSAIRAWLQRAFLETAFSGDQQAMIADTVLDNGAMGSPLYDSPSTTDKIFLLSYGEAVDPAYGFSTSFSAYDAARRAACTDYAKCQGIWTSGTSQYAGNAYWWLRSPGEKSDTACYISDGGWGGGDDNVLSAGQGVRPAFCFRSVESG
ncbi:MAG: hypothetical protein IJJ85_00545 [Clostridia bacterium]|nr:hypothetical protein [Clostridia bacterium]